MESFAFSRWQLEARTCVLSQGAKLRHLNSIMQALLPAPHPPPTRLSVGPRSWGSEGTRGRSVGEGFLGRQLLC